VEDEEMFEAQTVERKTTQVNYKDIRRNLDIIGAK
jgi:hypothetical protein